MDEDETSCNPLNEADADFLDLNIDKNLLKCEDFKRIMRYLDLRDKDLKVTLTNAIGLTNQYDFIVRKTKINELYKCRILIFI